VIFIRGGRNALETGASSSNKQVWHFMVAMDAAQRALPSGLTLFFLFLD